MADVNPLVIVGIVVLVVLLFIGNVYILVSWQSAEDKHESYMSKVIVVVGLQIAEMAIMLIPIDVANNEGDIDCDAASASVHDCGGVNMMQFWWTVFCFIAILLIIFIPAVTFYYEADDGMLLTGTVTSSKFWAAVKWEIFIIICTLIVLLSAYFTAANVGIHVKQYTVDFNDLTQYNIAARPGSSPYSFVPLSVLPADLAISPTEHNKQIEFSVDFVAYMVALVGWIGWWVFSIACGVGLAALPFDFLLNYIHRPRQLPPATLAELELELQRRTSELLDQSIEFRRERGHFRESGASNREKRKHYMEDRVAMNKTVQMYFLLERDVELYNGCKNVRVGNNPLVPYVQLMVGLLTLVISILWECHIAAYVLVYPPKTNLLNELFEWFDIWFPMFGALCYALFCLYLLFCTLKGFFKVGLRMFCVKIHPMKVGATPVNAFLYNIAMILLCTIPVVHLCAISFSGYARYSEIYYIIGWQITYLHFFSHFHTSHVFIWILFLTCPLTGLYLIWKPKETSGPSSADIMEDIKSRGSMYSRVKSAVVGEKEVTGKESREKKKKGKEKAAVKKGKKEKEDSHRTAEKTTV
jgi:LMBR1 domain-containing protein 1